MNGMPSTSCYNIEVIMGIEVVYVTGECGLQPDDHNLLVNAIKKLLDLVSTISDP